MGRARLENEPDVALVADLPLMVTADNIAWASALDAEPDDTAHHIEELIDVDEV